MIRQSHSGAPVCYILGVSHHSVSVTGQEKEEKLPGGKDNFFSCEDAAQQVLMSVCLSVCQFVVNWSECMQNVQEFIQNVQEYMQNVPECSRMHAECSRMFQNA